MSRGDATGARLWYPNVGKSSLLVKGQLHPPPPLVPLFKSLKRDARSSLRGGTRRGRVFWKALLRCSRPAQRSAHRAHHSLQPNDLPWSSMPLFTSLLRAAQNIQTIYLYIRLSLPSCCNPERHSRTRFCCFFVVFFVCALSIDFLRIAADESQYAFTGLFLTQVQYLEWNLASEKLKGFSPLKYAILSFGKCRNY